MRRKTTINDQLDRLARHNAQLRTLLAVEYRRGDRYGKAIAASLSAMEEADEPENKMDKIELILREALSGKA